MPRRSRRRRQRPAPDGVPPRSAEGAPSRSVPSACHRAARWRPIPSCPDRSWRTQRRAHSRCGPGSLRGPRVRAHHPAGPRQCCQGGQWAARTSTFRPRPILFRRFIGARMRSTSSRRRPSQPRSAPARCRLDPGRDRDTPRLAEQFSAIPAAAPPTGPRCPRVAKVESRKGLSAQSPGSAGCTLRNGGDGARRPSPWTRLRREAWGQGDTGAARVK